MITIHDFVGEYQEAKNGYNIDGHDAAMLVLALAIHEAAAHICRSINMDNEAPSIGEGLSMIADALSRLE